MIAPPLWAGGYQGPQHIYRAMTSRTQRKKLFPFSRNWHRLRFCVGLAFSAIQLTGGSMKALLAGFSMFLCLVVILLFPTLAAAQKLMVGYSGVTAIQAPFWVIK